MSSVWHSLVMHTSAVAARGDGTVFVMAGSNDSEQLYEWPPGVPVAAPAVVLNTTLGQVPVGSPLRYNPETDLLYTVASTGGNQLRLASCRCGQCTVVNTVCTSIGGIDVERDPCAEHKAAVYYTCDHNLMRWDLPLPQ